MKNKEQISEHRRKKERKKRKKERKKRKKGNIILHYCQITVEPR
jgi:predicted nucleic acid-binding protein